MACTQRAKARHAEYSRRYRPLDQQQPGAMAAQAEPRAYNDPGQHQGTDHIKPTVPEGTDGHAQGREHPADQQRCHGRHASRAQHVVGRQRGGNVEDHDHGDRPEPTTLRRGSFGGSAAITAGIHANGPSVTLRKPHLPPPGPWLRSRARQLTWPAHHQPSARKHRSFRPMRQGRVLVMTGRQLTPFEHILLGLIFLAPASGYDLKRIFAATPMGVYQPTSAALYPPLPPFDLTLLVPAQAPASQDGQSARHRRVYELTQTGQAAHMSWLRTPVEPATVSRDLGLHLMRFVMMEHLLPPEEVLTFLQNLADALAAR